MASMIIKAIIFMMIFITVYFGGHYYVFARLATYFDFPKNIWFIFTVTLFALFYIISALLEKFFSNGFSRILFILSSTWLGIVFLLAATILLADILNLFLHIKGTYIGTAVLVFVSIISIIAIINAQTLHVKEVEVPIKDLKEDLRIVQLSDIHLGTIHKYEYLKNIVKLTNKQNPDIVAITGDLFDGSGPVNIEDIRVLNNLTAKAFFVTGNHERYEGIDNIEEVLSKTDVTVLRNEITTYKGIQIIGIDDPEEELKNQNKELEKIKINDSIPSILLFHRPNGIKESNKAGIDLQLSGHTHNGQIIPFSLIVKLAFRYTMGLYNYNGTYIYVSPGTGTWGPPMRLGSRSEITVLNLTKS